MRDELSPVSRAILQTRELERAMQSAARQLDSARSATELQRAEELAARAAELASLLQRTVSLFYGSVKSEVTMRRRTTLC